jgi:long-chain fatty acid transport protein
LDHGTNEYLAGLEWDVCKLLTLSAGYQLTDMGLSDNFQSDVAFSCSSYCVGFGGALNLGKGVKLNLAYMFTNYKNYNMEFVNKHAIAPNVEVPSVMGSKIYKRTNQVFGLGVDYTF